MGEQVVAAFAGFGEIVCDQANEFFFGMTVAVTAGPVGRRDLGLLVGVGKELDQRKDMVLIRILRRFQRRRGC